MIERMMLGTARGPDGLIATKLSIPRSPHAYVPRPRLNDRLSTGLQRELTLVSAPAGSGKTALLADWSRHSPWRVAWLSLDAGDNDPARFWDYVSAALRGAGAAPGGRGASLNRTRGRPDSRTLVTDLINGLAARPDGFALVIDDYHLIEAEAVHASVAFLLDHCPPQLRIVLASRSDPPLPLARLRARGQLTELRTADLRFTTDEAASLLSGLLGPAAVPEPAVAALEARSEGWAAGLQLAALSLRGRQDPAAFIAAFGGTHRFVLDYLAEEVLARQPQQVVAFLLDTSVLDQLTADLCDAVTGRGDGQALLERLEAANLFLVPLDDERCWYRYHHLFAEFLRARLAREQPGRAVELHRAAATWYRRRGLLVEAVDHALAAGDTRTALELIELVVEELIWWRSRAATLERWLALLPRDAILARPRLCLALGWQALLAGRLDQAASCLEAAARAPLPSRDEPFVPTIGRELSELANFPGRARLQPRRPGEPPRRGRRRRELCPGVAPPAQRR